MNIFALHKNPDICARWHCDKHVIKMILESAQMICTTHHLHPSGNYDIPYKKTHENHPCAKWVRSSMSNYLWLLNLVKALNTEYRFRYDKQVNHKSYDVVQTLPLPDISDIGMTDFARAMPDEYKILDNVVCSYRFYYKFGKTNILHYTKRNSPSWLWE